MVGLRGKVVVITGAGGIGSETARAFAEEGCRVAVCDRLEDRLESVRERLEGSAGEVFTMVADVSDELQVRDFVEAAVGALGAGGRAGQQRRLRAAQAVPQNERGGDSGPATDQLHGGRARYQSRAGAHGARPSRPHSQRRLGGRQAPRAELRQLRGDQSGAGFALLDPSGPSSPSSAS